MALRVERETLPSGGVFYRVWGIGAGAGTSVLLSRNFAVRQLCVLWYMEQNGGSLFMNEGLRPTGCRSDTDVRSASLTCEGISTQWFQVGRMWRGETPDAIVPNADGTNLSKHATGNASDTNAPTTRDMDLRRTGAVWAGCGFPVASESWHMEATGAPQADFTTFYNMLDAADAAADLGDGLMATLPVEKQLNALAWARGLRKGNFPKITLADGREVPYWQHMIWQQEQIVAALGTAIGARVNSSALTAALLARLEPVIDELDVTGTTGEEVVTEIVTRATAGAAA